MQLRDAIDDHKRHVGHATRFPGERRTLSGRFTGTGGRLVHVDADGRLRDFGSPLTGHAGLTRARFGLIVAGDVTWLDDVETHQSYVGETALVRTVHETAVATVRRHDLTIGDAHLTHVTVEPDPDADVDPSALSLAVYAVFSPDGREHQVGQLRFDDAVEVYHDTEHDYLASATGFDALGGELPMTIPEILGPDPVDLPRDRDGERYEEEQLSGELLAAVPFEDGSTVVGSLLTERPETTREAARDRLDELFDEFGDLDALVEAAGEATPSLPDSVPEREAIVADLRVLSLLSAATGLRIAGPDFDPHFLHSGGYGYTWFRDDAEISTFLLDADARLGVGLGDWHERSARMYVATQRPDGSWPHRVWPRNGALAPGWANARIEDGSGVDYQADQTGSVIAFLSRARAAGVDIDGLDAALVRALGSLDETLADDGRPVVCQNAWEDTNGRFTHTTATFLEAYSDLARHGTRLEADEVEAGVDGDPAAHAAERAREVYDALDDLWIDERGCYALRETPDGAVDDRLDSATLSLAAAHRSFDALSRTAESTAATHGAAVGGVGEERLDRLVEHVETIVDGLAHETDAIAGLIRYEGDGWRQAGQASEKVWTVSTAWGANACAELAVLLADHDDPRAERLAERARDLLAHVSPGGSLCAETSYLPEQLFDDGTPDSATPLGWPHAIRLATIAILDDHDLLTNDPIPADD
ncbi:hypothetical protein JCM18237_18980 [Halorubrum luteum]